MFFISHYAWYRNCSLYFLAYKSFWILEWSWRSSIVYWDSSIPAHNLLPKLFTFHSSLCAIPSVHILKITLFSYIPNALGFNSSSISTIQPSLLQPEWLSPSYWPWKIYTPRSISLEAMSTNRNLVQRDMSLMTKCLLWHIFSDSKFPYTSTFCQKTLLGFHQFKISQWSFECGYYLFT